MSDAAVANLVTGLVTITIQVIGFLTIWVKLKYGVEQVEEASTKAAEAVTQAAVVEGKIDNNTLLTTQAKDAAQKAEKQTNGTMSRIDDQVSSHHDRIAALEAQMTAIKLSVESTTKEIASTRHEMRGHLQTIGNKLDLLAITGTTRPPAGGTP